MTIAVGNRMETAALRGEKPTTVAIGVLPARQYGQVVSSDEQ
jgi:hypothetical protein